MNRKRFLTLTALLTVLISVSVLLAGCGGGIKPQEVAEEYLRLWKEGRYKEAYSFLTSQSAEKISEEDFIKKYENIYQGIELNAISYEMDEPVEDGERVIIPFTAVYDTALAGKMTYQFQLPMEKEEESWKIDWSPALIFPQMEDGDKIRVSTTEPSRGEIFDRNGDPLALNQYATTVWGNLDKIGDPEDFAAKLAPLLDLKPENVMEKLNSKEAQRDRIAVFKAYLPGTLSQELEEKLLAIKGVGIDSKRFTPIRYYPEGTLLAHTLGYTGAISEEELEKLSDQGYEAHHKIGKAGLEQAYEKELVGKRGYSIDIIGEDNKKKLTLTSADKEDGMDLHLTIDLPLQQKAEELLSAKLPKDQRGTIVILEPATGEILAMASAPTFDPNIFSFRISQEDWEKLNDKDRKPLFNRVTQGLYPPGSTFKPFTAAMALEEGKLTPDFVFKEEITQNQWKPQGKEWPYPPITRVPHPAGPLNLENALIWSDNIFFAYAAMEVGKEAFQDYAGRYGLGDAIPFDLGVAKSKISNKAELESEKLLADSGYGQGELLITPLQMASTFSALANDGSIMRPRVVESLYKMEGEEYVAQQTYEPEVWKADVMKAETISILLPALEKVVSDREGTGHAVHIEDMPIAGKTGTAEVGENKDREISWFTGFTRENDPNLLVCVALEAPAKKDGEVKMDITRELFSYIQKKFGN
jgi:cell division protein FtsI/penicillin-binding protein 2